MANPPSRSSHPQAADVHLHSLCDERIKCFGGDNPDTRHFGASISSEHACRLSGDFGGCSYFTPMTTGFDAQGAYWIIDGDGIPGARTGRLSAQIPVSLRKRASCTRCCSISGAATGFATDSPGDGSASVAPAAIWSHSAR